MGTEGSVRICKPPGHNEQSFERWARTECLRLARFPDLDQWEKCESVTQLRGLGEGNFEQESEEDELRAPCLRNFWVIHARMSSGPSSSSG